jgi:cytoskeletal protein CcmA (bactofilin family)
MWERVEADQTKGRQPNAPIQDERRTTAWIGKGVRINGDVIAAEDILIDGQVDGRITVRDHHLTVGSGATINAEIVARRITIHGTIVGNVSASERMQICETGSVQGTIKTPRFSMNEGAVLSGRVDQYDAEPRLVPVAV